MTAPRRWREDPEADSTLRDLLQRAPTARPLDAITRRRLGVKVARVSVLPVAAAGWLFVKSATAALGVVLGSGALAVSAGIIEWGPPPAASPAVSLAPVEVRAPTRRLPVVAPEQAEAAPEEALAPEPAPQLNPTPTLPIDSSGSSRGLSAEAALLESARSRLRVSAAQALAISGQHAARFPRGQLSSERKLIQIEALHRLGRDAEARALSQELLRGTGTGLYADRVRQLLGEAANP